MIKYRIKYDLRQCVTNKRVMLSRGACYLEQPQSHLKCIDCIC